MTLQDQDGRAVRFEHYFRGKPAVVAFFYTRCDNPAKCSLSIATLARLQDELERRGLGGKVRLAAITYDPSYDLPKRLKNFGEFRGIRFNDDVRFFRAVLRRSRETGTIGAIAASMAGAALLVGSFFVCSGPAGIVGALLLAAGALVSATSSKYGLTALGQVNFP